MDATPDGDPLLDSVRLARQTGPAWRIWLRERSTGHRRLLVGVLFLLPVALNFLFFRRQDWFSYPALRMGIAVLGFFILASLILTATLVAPGRPGAVSARGAILFTSFALPVGLAALPAARDVASPPELWSAAFWGSAGKCLLWGGLMGVPLLALLAAVDRAATLSRETVLLGIALAGVAGNLVLQVHCPVVDPGHLFWGHALLPAVLAVATLPLLLRG